MDNKKLVAIITTAISEMTQLSSDEFNIKSIDKINDKYEDKVDLSKNSDQKLWSKAGRIELMNSAHNLNQLRL